jgi:tetratricopeptide (TPR) repeat protein
LGVVLAPAGLYLLFADSRVGCICGQFSAKVKLIATVVSFVILMIALQVVGHYSYFFRFVFVPLAADEFAVEGYTLFSAAHLLDFLNLLMVLLPSLLIMIALLWANRRKTGPSARQFVFLGVLVCCTLIAAFLFDPKLGMPRDWDLFAFPGIPLVTLLYLQLLEEGSTPARYRRVVILSLVLSVLAFGPRVVALALPDIAISHLQKYLALDRARGRMVRQVLVDYYFERGDSALAIMERQNWDEAFPEEAIFQQARRAYGARDYRSTINLCRRALSYEGVFHDNYLLIGSAYMELGQYDSAQHLLSVSIGLNPYNPVSNANLGYVFMETGDLDAAEDQFKFVLEIDPKLTYGWYRMTEISLRRGNLNQARQRFGMLLECSDIPPVFLRRLAEQFYQLSDYQRARIALLRAYPNGVDSARYEQFKADFPLLDF